MIYYAKAKISLGAVEAKGQADLKCPVSKAGNPLITNPNSVIFYIYAREKDKCVGTILIIPIQPIAIPQTDHHRPDACIYAGAYVCVVALLLKDEVRRYEIFRIIAPPWVARTRFKIHPKVAGELHG